MTEFKAGHYYRCINRVVPVTDAIWTKLYDGEPHLCIRGDSTGGVFKDTGLTRWSYDKAYFEECSEFCPSEQPLPILNY